MTQPIPITVEYSELPGSDRHSWDPRGLENTVEKVFLVGWEDSFLFCKQMLGSITQIGLFVEVVPSHPHPVRPELSALKCFVEGLGNPWWDQYNNIQYPKAQVTVQYGIPEIDSEEPEDGGGGGREKEEKDIVYATTTVNWTTETLLFKTWNFVWETDKAAVSEDGGASVTIVKAEVDIMLQFWFDYPAYQTKLPARLGKVNASDIKLNKHVWPKDTLMFAGFSEQHKYTTDGKRAWEANLKFLYREPGWSKALRTTEYTNQGKIKILKPPRWEEVQRALGPETWAPLYDQFNVRDILPAERLGILR